MEYKQLYRGISLTFYGNGEELEHDFQVDAGADPAQIALSINGANKKELNPDGNLLVHATNGVLVLRKPVAYQTINGGRQTVSSSYRINADGSIGFELGGYDHGRPLVIDPVLVFATYLAGSTGDQISAVTTDASGDIVVTGNTWSADFPMAQALQPSLNGEEDAFISKFDPTGKDLIFSTFLGGSDGNTANAVCVDASGNVIVAGTSSSNDFPHAGVVISPVVGIGDSDFFIASVKADGSALNYAGLIGGMLGFYLNSGTGYPVLTVDTSGNAYLAGQTDDQNFQITPGTLGTAMAANADELFVMKVDPTGKLAYSTLVPGNVPDDETVSFADTFIPYGIVVDQAGNAAVAGAAGLGLPTTPGVLAPQMPNPNSSDWSAGFLLQLNSTASAVQLATYLPSTYVANALAVDSKGNWLIATGHTVMKLDPKATEVMASTSIGSMVNFGAIALDAQEDVILGGSAWDESFPMQNPLISIGQNLGGSPETGYQEDMILAELSPDLSTLKFGSYLSAPSTSIDSPGSTLGGIAVDPSGDLVVAGTTYSQVFPTTAGTFESQLPAGAASGTAHGFVAKINLATPAGALCFDPKVLHLGNGGAGVTGTQGLNIANCGNAPLTISEATTSLSFVSVQQSCGVMAPGASCTVTVKNTPPNLNTFAGTITFADNGSMPTQSLAFDSMPPPPSLSNYPYPRIVISTATIDFGHLLVGGMPGLFPLPIANSGGAPLVVGNESVSGTGFSIQSNGCAQPVAPGGSCQIVLAFAPTATGVQDGSLTMTSNDSNMLFPVVPLVGVGDTAFSFPAIQSTSPGVIPLNSGSINLTISGSNFYPESVVKVNGTAVSGEYIDNSTLQITVPASMFTAIADLPIIVVNPQPGGGVASPGWLTVYDTVLNDASALASVPSTGLIYAAIPDGATQYTNTVVPINPGTGKLGSPIPVGNNPQSLIASADGAYLFVANDGDHTVQRISLATNTVDRTYSYQVSVSCPSCAPPDATDLQPMPGAPQQFLLAQGSILSLYNDAGLVNSVQDSADNSLTAFFDSISLAGNPLTAYSLPLPYGGSTNPYFDVVNIGAQGLQVAQANQSVGFPPTLASQVVSDGNVLYTSDGQAWDTRVQALTGNFPGCAKLDYNTHNLAVDPPLGELYCVEQQYGSLASYLNIALNVYSTRSLALLGTITFPQSDYPSVESTVRWGTDGLAFIGAGAGKLDQEVYLLHSHLVASQLENPAPVLTSAIAADQYGGPGFTLTVNGTGFVLGSQVLWNGTPLTTSFLSGQTMTANVPASLTTAQGAIQITVVTPQPGGGTSGAQPFTFTTYTSLTATPLQVQQGTSVTLSATVQTVFGSGVPEGSVSFYNGSTLLETDELANGSASMTTTALPPGSDLITVSYSGNAAFAASSSGPASVAVSILALTINSTYPAFTSAGSTGFSLSVTGSGFNSNSVILWGSTPLTTQFTSITQIYAQVTAAQIASAGKVAISVQNTGSASGTSNTWQFEIDSVPPNTTYSPAVYPLAVAVTRGGTASYGLGFAQWPSALSANCLNVPSGVTCAWNASTGYITLATSPTALTGSYSIVVVFTETVPVTTTALVLLPFLLLPASFRKRRKAVRWIGLACMSFALLCMTAAYTGCGGGGTGTTSTQPPPQPSTHQVTGSVNLGLTVQ